MAQSYATYTGNGSTTDYTVSFSYLDSTDVFVYVDGISVPFTFLSTSLIRCVTAPANLSIVQVRRNTQKVTPPVNFTDGSTLLEDDLDRLSLYTLYLAQEGDDATTAALLIIGQPSFQAIADDITAKAAEASASAVAAASYIGAGTFKNKIINGSFKINQRGYVSGDAVGAANTYTLDRWRVVTSGQSVSFSASGNGNQVTAPAGGLEQVIEGVNIDGGTYVVNWVGAGTCTVNGTPRTKGATFTLTANTDATVRLVGVVSKFQLEAGGTASAFEERGIGAELVLCQRYYERYTTDVSGTCVAVGQCITGSSAIVVFPFKVQKRVAPSSMEQSGTWTVLTAGAGSAGGTIVLNSANVNSARIDSAGGSGLVSGNATQLFLNTLGGYIAFSAEF